MAFAYGDFIFKPLGRTKGSGRRFLPALLDTKLAPSNDIHYRELRDKSNRSFAIRFSQPKVKDRADAVVHIGRADAKSKSLLANKKNLDPQFGSGTNYQVFSEWFDQWLQPEVKSNFSIAQNSRIVKSGFLDEAIVARLLHMSSKINPESNDYTVYNPFMGADISTILLITDASSVIGCDIGYNEDFCTKLNSLDPNTHNRLESLIPSYEQRINDDGDMKKISSWANYYSDIKSKGYYRYGTDDNESKNLVLNLLMELKALGAKNVDYSELGEISFDWRHPKSNVFKRRTIRFINADATNYMPNDSFDCFVQKCAFDYHVPDRVHERLPEHGSIVLGPFVNLEKERHDAYRSSLLNFRNEIPEVYYAQIDKRKAFTPYGWALSVIKKANLPNPNNRSSSESVLEEVG